VKRTLPLTVRAVRVYGSVAASSWAVSAPANARRLGIASVVLSVASIVITALVVVLVVILVATDLTDAA